MQTDREVVERDSMRQHLREHRARKLPGAASVAAALARGELRLEAATNTTLVCDGIASAPCTEKVTLVLAAVVAKYALGKREPGPW